MVDASHLTLVVPLVVPPLRVFPDLGGGLKDRDGAALGFSHRMDKRMDGY